jgi:ATP dependent DNA ligase domain
MLYYAFDLLYLDGFDPRAAPLLDRKRVLQSFLAEAAHASPDVIYSEHFKDGADFYAQACDMQLEGVVSKRVDAPYRSERTEDWIKVKCWRTGHFLVVGFVPGAGGMSALRLGRREGRRARLCRQGRHRLQSQVGCRRATATRAARGEAAAADQADPEAGYDPGRAEIRTRDCLWTHHRDGLVRHPSFKRCLPADANEGPRRAGGRQGHSNSRCSVAPVA